MALKFRTEVHPKAFPFKMGLKQSFMSIGSCFSENIGNHLLRIGLSGMVNPYGILFNPHSVGICLKEIIENSRTDESDLALQDALWHSWKHHGKFSRPDKEDALKDMNKSLSHAYEKLDQTKLLIITFGSAWVYKHHTYGIVANCHKVHQKEFSKELLSVSDIVSTWSPLLQALKDRSPGLQVIFTLSPVRHWKDGAEGNSLSKAILRTTIEELVTSHSNSHYFPAYELLLDDLRDYRWFKDDMLHPSDRAIEYIWQKFIHAIFQENQLSYIHEREKLEKLRSHFSNQKDMHIREYEEKKRTLLDKYFNILN